MTRRVEGLWPIAGRPDLLGDRTSDGLWGMNGMAENAFINVKNRGLKITRP